MNIDNTQLPGDGAHKVAYVFSVSRDVDSLNPYHEDGDIDMYNETNIYLRKQLRNNELLNKELDNLISLYNFEYTPYGPAVGKTYYKRIQKKVANVLRPDVDGEELTFILYQDWYHDSEGKSYITKEKLKEGLFEMIDVWTVGVDLYEYISFCKLLKKKLERSKDKK